jgi:primosomal protein N' (replication factor Y)
VYHRVALLTPPYASLTYARPVWLADDPAWRIGTRVLAPLGNACRMGVLLDDGRPDADLPAGVEAKAMLWPLDTPPILSGEYMELARQLALRQMQSMGRILAAFLPAGLRTIKPRLRVEQAGAPRQWSVRQLRDLEAKARISGPPPELDAIVQAWRQGRAKWLLPREDAAQSEVCVLLKDPPWPVRPAASRQRAVLDCLWEHGAVSRRRLAQAVADVSVALNALIRDGLVGVRVRGWADGDAADAAHEDLLAPPEAVDGLCPNIAQQEALDACLAALAANRPAARLLYGVTGSGKTLVYIRLAAACLAAGRSVLLLAPEVALAHKLRRDVRAALPDAPVFFVHGYQDPAYRDRLFRELAARVAPCLVVGTRSALFVPMPGPGLIVLDEEHDASFKQEEGLPYQAKEVAWFRAGQARALLLLGSATPDIKTFHAACRGDIPVDRLPVRVGNGRLPEISLTDIRGVNPEENLLAPDTLQAVREVAARGEQAVILLNRRGYAPHMYCLDCGTVARCPDCDIGLTYHKNRERLICHYCGYAVSFPAVCAKCRGLHYLPMGQGTERLEEHIASILPPGGRVLRLDRDATRRPGRMEEILESFARKEAQVLVGTQMLSKGHHFPEVTLAVVADGDLGLNLPDYRAAERTFQLLLQSAGRAGRGGKPSRVIIQTRDTAHYCWQFVRNADYEGFYAREIALREKRRYPPFVRLALLRMSFSAGWEEGPEAVGRLAACIRAAGQACRVTVLGPAPAPLPLLRARRRFHCLLKTDDWSAIRNVFAAVSDTLPGALRVTLDLAPVNML